VYDLGEWHRRLHPAGGGRFTLIREPADLHAARDTGHTGILLGFQDCTQLERDPRNTETFHGLGVRMIQLSYNGPSDAGYGCTSERDHGLTGFGRDLIRAMNDLGMIIDVSHCGPRTTIEAITYSGSPVAVSHSACAAIHRHARNKDDTIPRALADTGGYFGVCAVPTFLAPRHQRPSLDHMVRHITHAAEVAGPDRVGIGTDWGVACSPEPIRRRLQQEANKRGFRAEDDFDFQLRTEGFETWAAGYPRITERLLAAGFTDSQAQGILGQNFQHFYQAVHATARA
jgi:membrane dipeptidase